MKPTTRHLALSAFALLGTLTALNTQALEMPAGKWGMNSETLTPMSPEPRKDYSEECIAEDFDPTQMLADSEMAEQCQIIPTKDTDTEFTSDIKCDMGEAGSSSGTMSIMVNGEEANGEMIMTVTMAGQSLQVTNKWSGQRLGACD